MKTRAELFRNAKAKAITLELVERWGSRDISENMQGKRTIGKVQTNGFYLINKDGKESFLDIEKASLVEYTGDELKIYAPGFREMTEKEKQAMMEWEEIENTENYQEQARVDMLSDGSTTFCMKKKFFMDRKMEYLTGTSNGIKSLMFSKYYNGEKECIRDDSVKGNVILIYKVERI